ncbi:MAG: hypothetical protein KDC98_14260 [Planctomycetes bacterium]|nr:hypothetical protein [Planctomycetota bacterium]
MVPRVRRLAKADELDKKLLFPDRSNLPWSEWLSIMHWIAWVAAGIAVAVFALADRPPGVDADFAHPSFLTALALIPFGAVCWLLSFVVVPRWERTRRRLGRRGAILPAAIVMVHTQWFEEDDDRPWWGMVAFSFDPKALAEPQRLRDIGRSLFALKEVDRRTLPEDQVRVAWTLYHEMGPVRSQPVPAALSHGLAGCFMANVQFPPDALIDDGLLVALALPDDRSPDAAALLTSELL